VGGEPAGGPEQEAGAGDRESGHPPRTISPTPPERWVARRARRARQPEDEWPRPRAVAYHRPSSAPGGLETVAVQRGLGASAAEAVAEGEGEPHVRVQLDRCVGARGAGHRGDPAAAEQRREAGPLFGVPLQSGGTRTSAVAKASALSGRVSEHASVVSSRCTRRLTSLVVAAACVAAVMSFGELSTGALVGVGSTGVLVAVVGLAGRAGEAAAPVGRRGLPWLGWLAAGVAWEVLTLLIDDLPTLSDLADPFLAHPAMRGAATVGWLVAGAWLLTRPRHRPERP
jgi:hypothetical protein